MNGEGIMIRGGQRRQWENDETQFDTMPMHIRAQNHLSTCHTYSLTVGTSAWPASTAATITDFRLLG